MSSAAFCGDCGVRTNPHRVVCPKCGAKTPHSQARQNPALYAKVTRELPRAAVFDLDMTLFDNTQRFKDARRAGLIDKDGKAVAKGMMSEGQAWRKRNNFLYSKKNLRKDKIMPGAKQLIDTLTREGYTIIYLTSRPKANYEATIEQLEYFGFPLFRDNKGETLLIMKERLNAQVGAYKGNALRELSGNYKVEMFFDDDDRALKEALKLQIPGVYSTVEQRTNPGAGDVYVSETDDPDEAMLLMPDPDDEDERTVGQTLGVHGTNPSHTEGYRHAAGAIIMQGDQVLLLRRSTKETSRHGMWELPGGKLEEGETPEEAALNETKEESGLEVVIDKKVGEHIDHNKKKIYHAYIAEPKNVNQEVKLSKEHDESLWATLDEALAMEEGKLSHHAQYFFAKMRVIPNPAKRGKDSKGPYYRWGNGKKYYYKAGNKKSREAARKKAYGQAKAAFASGYRKNPANPKKVQKGKKLYKHMNGQDPEKVKVEKIDIGDVWYKVGEGGCWQIGYMSGKETGKEDQKYIHTFNEETQDGNFPELYATMPEKGKPMLIIKGGTWKIRTDDKGVAWIYD